MIRAFEGLDKFTHFLERLAVGQEAAFIAAAEATSHALHKNALAVFGDNQKLAPLAQSTQDERTALGYSANDPLLRDGSLLRDSVDRMHEGMVAAVGSSEPIMAFHEFGYDNARTGTAVPARPVFETALTDTEKDVEIFLEAAIDAALGGALPGRSAEVQLLP